MRPQIEIGRWPHRRSKLKKIRTFGNALIAAALLAGGATTALRATAPPNLASAAPVAQTEVPLFKPEIQLTDLKPEVRMPVRYDTSTVSMAALDASGLYKPDEARSPSAFEQIRKRLNRAAYTPQQLEELKQKAPAVYETLGVAGDSSCLLRKEQPL